MSKKMYINEKGPLNFQILLTPAQKKFMMKKCVAMNFTPNQWIRYIVQKEYDNFKFGPYNRAVYGD